MAEIQMTEENRPYIEALMRMAAGFYRDERAQEVLVEGIQELVALRAEHAQLQAKQERAVDWLLEAIKDLRGVPRNAEYVVNALTVLVGTGKAEELIGALDEQLRLDRLARKATGDPNYQPVAGDILYADESFPMMIQRGSDIPAEDDDYADSWLEQIIAQQRIDGKPVNEATLHAPEPPLLPSETAHDWEHVKSYHITTSIDEEGLPGLSKVRVAQCRACGALWRHL